jgi:hypothetical protein
MAANYFTFPCAVRGFHVYQRIWQPTLGENVDCGWEQGNQYDRFAIKCTDTDNRVIDHLPMEISRITKFLIARGAVVQATVTNMRYRASPLVQGGLEVPCLVTVTTGGTFDHNVIRRYQEVLAEVYQEPQDPIYKGTVGQSTSEPNRPGGRVQNRPTSSSISSIRQMSKIKESGNTIIRPGGGILKFCHPVPRFQDDEGPTPTKVKRNENEILISSDDDSD